MHNHDTIISLKRLGTESLQALAKIFDAAAVFAVDKNRKLTFWSKGAERLLGYLAEDLVGENCLSGNHCQECLQGCGISDHGQINGSPIRLYHANGKSLLFRKYATAYYDDSGNFNGGVEVLIPDFYGWYGSAINSQDTLNVFHSLVSADPVMRNVFDLVTRVAQTDVNVLVRGESGTGKELIARAIHSESLRKDKPFMTLNCASLNANLLESELFGHVKGAFTDAIRDHVGLVSRAEGGTLFLDEIAETSLETQAKLLRVIQEREYTPVGSTNVIKANIRIIAATHQSLRKLVHEGRFREDLMYRLRVVPIFLPPLRERKNDIPILINHFMNEFERNSVKRITNIHPDAMRLLINYEWPGNVREIRNVLEYANAVSRSSTVTTKDLPPEFLETKTNKNKDKDEFTNKSELKNIKDALKESDGDLALTAQILGISRTTLWRKRKKYKI